MSPSRQRHDGHRSTRTSRRPGLSRLLVLASACVALGLALASAQSPPRADAVAQRLQQRYQKVSDFEADFVETHSGGVLGVKSRAEGHIYVKRPGRMRWSYSKPDRQDLFWDGQKVIQYLPQEKHATISSTSGDKAGSSALLFLAGKGDLMRDFVPSLAESKTPGTVALKLTPRQREPDYDHLVVTMDDRTTQIRSLLWRDGLGAETTTEFRNIKENVNIPDRTFVFTPPRGVDVFTDGAVR